LTELELTTCTGKLFHIFMILWVKTYLHISYLEKFLTNFQVLPLVTESWLMYDVCMYQKREFGRSSCRASRAGSRILHGAAESGKWAG